MADIRVFFRNGPDFPETPFFIYDEEIIFHALKRLDAARLRTACKVLFSLKSFSFCDALYLMAPFINGYSASSLFEAKLGRQIIGATGIIHMITPGYKIKEIGEISRICDYVTFNSISQWERFSRVSSEHTSCGLRINPQLSFVEDKRYDPCSEYSKLGVQLEHLKKELNNNTQLYKEIQGVHIHTNSSSDNYRPLLQTVEHLTKNIPELLSTISWINLGGGYLVNEVDFAAFYEIISFLKDKYGFEIFIEPGQGIVEEAGYIVSKVIDILESDGKEIAVLDTSVNHMPEVFEYAYRPDIIEESGSGKFRYILAGCSCLAGDLFGEYRFDDPLEIGSRIVFENMGAYTLVKANMFNGINLPAIYAYTLDGKLEMKKQFTYEDFLSRCGANGNVPL